MTESTPTAQRLLDEDAGLRGCLAALTGQKPATLDDFVACYGDEEPTDAEQRMYEELSEMTGVPMRPTGEARALDVERSVTSLDIAVALGIPFHDRETGTRVLPRDVVETVNTSYAEIAKAGYLTERDFEEKLYAWLSESSGARGR
ncbi:MAG: hypothetical protein H0U00_15375 [Actinobacteria bacterium]|nr:hypothetical protein [Actinomycetota bacterium]